MNVIFPKTATMDDIKDIAERMGLIVKHKGFGIIELREKPEPGSNVRSLRRPAFDGDGNFPGAA